MQIENRVSKSGFVVGWEPAALGNSLSCLATMYLLSMRTSLPAAYEYVNKYRSLFRSGNIPTIIDPQGTLDIAEYEVFRTATEILFQQLPYAPEKVQGTDYAQLKDVNVSGVVWFTKHQIGLKDWGDDEADLAVSKFCSKGNGLIISGCYWRQFMDMRNLKQYTSSLRDFLGPLRVDGQDRRLSSMMSMKDGLKIGLHCRLAADYGVWMGGIYHFNADQYRSIVSRLTLELQDTKHQIYIFSDVDLNGMFNQQSQVFDEGGEYYDDFAGLSSCDIVVGAPSTFATWASYLGSAKRLILTQEVISSNRPLLEQVVDVYFPTGSYLPGDVRSSPI